MSWAKDASGRARRACRLALNEIGRRGVADIRDSINVRVQYVGHLVIRSDPGEPPRREFGDLYRSIHYRVAPKAETVEALEIYTDRYPVAVYLEFGTTFMEPRPFFEPQRKKMRGVKRLFEQLFNEFLKGER
jgi:hypothetical protein